MQIVKDVKLLASYLDDNARGEADNNAARHLRQLVAVYEVAYEMVHAKTHEHSRNAYTEIIELIKKKSEK